MGQCSGEDFLKMVRHDGWKFGYADLSGRLNSKVKPRNVAVTHLITDLQDGV